MSWTDRRGLRYAHLPRLDWQMWFAALAGDCRTVPLVYPSSSSRLLEGSPAVLGLLRDNPFPDTSAAFCPRTIVSIQIHSVGFARLVVARGQGTVLSRSDD